MGTQYELTCSTWTDGGKERNGQMKQLGADLQARLARRRLVDRKAEGVILLDQADHAAPIRKVIDIGHGEHGRVAIRGKHSLEARLF